MRSLVCTLAALLIASSACAGSLDSPVLTARASHDPWHVDWLPPVAIVGAEMPRPRQFARPVLGLQDEAQPTHAAAVEHSDAYQTRARIHKYASFATLPLFAAELALGQSLYNASGNDDARRSAHAAVGAGIITLFGVNTVTGAWNLFGEGRRESQGRARRLAHGLLLMAADAGFLATWAAAPSSDGRGTSTFDRDKSTHRNLAIASVGTGTVGYLLMLFGDH